MILKILFLLFILNKTYSLPNIDSIVQLNEGINIIGTEFETPSTIKLNTLDISTSCVVLNNTTISCTTLPIGSQSGLLVVLNSNGQSNIKNLDLRPYIISLSKYKIIPNGDSLTINGRFFEEINYTTNQKNVIKIYSNLGLNVVNYTIENNSTIFLNIKNGNGIDILYVSINGRVSNGVQVTFSPYVKNFLQNNDGSFTSIVDAYSTTNKSMNKFYCNDLPAVVPDVVNEKLVFFFQATCHDGYIQYEFNGTKSLLLQYNFSPFISYIDPPKIHLNNDTIKINGLYMIQKSFYYQDSINVTVFFIPDNNPTESYLLKCIDNVGYSITCSGINSYNQLLSSGKIYVKRSFITLSTISNNVNISYQAPIVVKSTSLFYQEPGYITINVVSFNSSDIQVYVENVECLFPKAIDNFNIQCYYDASVPPNINGTSLEIKVISSNLIGKNNVFYYFVSLQCPNNCSNQGDCNEVNGECSCYTDYNGIDCSIKKQKPLPPPVINDNGDTILSGITINFTVSIVYLRELDLEGKEIKTLSMKSINWVNKTIINENETHYKGSFNNETVIVELDTTYYENAQDINFAGDIISIPDNSVKYIITISNYTFRSKLNTFQVIYNSETKQYYDNGCGELIETTSNSSSIVTDESVTWFQIVSGESVLDAKFSRRMFVDSIVRKSNVQILPLNDPLYKLLPNSTTFNKLTAINTPYFDTNIVLDPSFNSLLNSNGRNNDNCKSNIWKTVTIAVICSVVGSAILISIIIFTYKKYKNNLFFKNFENKMKQIQK